MRAGRRGGGAGRRGAGRFWCMRSWCGNFTRPAARHDQGRRRDAGLLWCMASWCGIFMCRARRRGRHRARGLLWCMRFWCGNFANAARRWRPTVRLHRPRGRRHGARVPPGGAGMPSVAPRPPSLGNRAPPRAKRHLLLPAPRAFLGNRHAARSEGGLFQFRRERQPWGHAPGQRRRQPVAAIHHRALQPAIAAPGANEELARPEFGTARPLGEAGSAQALPAFGGARAGAATAMHAATGLAANGRRAAGAPGTRARAAARGEMEVGIASALGVGRWRAGGKEGCGFRHCDRPGCWILLSIIITQTMPRHNNSWLTARPCGHVSCVVLATMLQLPS